MLSTHEQLPRRPSCEHGATSSRSVGSVRGDTWTAVTVVVTGRASLWANGRDFLSGRGGRCSMSGGVPDCRVIYRCSARRRCPPAAFRSGGRAAVTEERRSERDATSSVRHEGSRPHNAAGDVTPRQAVCRSAFLRFRRGRTLTTVVPRVNGFGRRYCCSFRL